MSLQYLADIESSISSKHGEEDLFALHWHEDGIILGGTSKGGLHAWHAQTGRHLGMTKKKVHGVLINAISSSSQDGKVVLTAALDGTIALWDASGISTSIKSVNAMATDESDTGVEAESISEFPLRLIESIKLGRREAIIQQNSEENDEEDESQRGQFFNCKRVFYTLLHPTKPIFMTTGPNANLVIRSCSKGRFGDEITCLEVPKDEKSLNSSQSTADGKEKKNGEYGLTMALHSCGEIVAIGTKMGYVQLFDIKEHEHLTKIKVGAEAVRCLHFTPDDQLLVGSNDGNVNVFDVRPFVPAALQSKRDEVDGEEEEGLFTDDLSQFEDDFQNCLSSQYTTSQASTFSDLFSQTQPQAQCNSIKPAKAWSSHSKLLTNVKASPDGRIVATSSVDGHVRIWDFKHPLIQGLCNINLDREIFAVEWKPIPKELAEFSQNDEERPLKRCKTAQIKTGTMTAAAQSVKTASTFVIAGRGGKIQWFRMAGGNTSS